MLCGINFEPLTEAATVCDGTQDAWGSTAMKSRERLSQTLSHKHGCLVSFSAQHLQEMTLEPERRHEGRCRAWAPGRLESVGPCFVPRLRKGRGTRGARISPVIPKTCSPRSVPGSIPSSAPAGCEPAPPPAYLPAHWRTWLNLTPDDVSTA